MADRRTLIDGLKSTPPPIDTGMEKAFVYGEKTAEPSRPSAPPNISSTVKRVPISTRMREEYAAALKRASLERQLNGIEPNSLQDILEAAIEPWLKTNGYL